MARHATALKERTYHFSELSPGAKQRAREWWHDSDDGSQSMRRFPNMSSTRMEKSNEPQTP